METLHCPFCDANLPSTEAADGWCETCGKKLPLSLVARAAEPKKQHSSSHLSAALGARGLGCVMLLVGAFVSYSSIYCPLAAAASHERIISLSRTGAFILPLCLVIGLIYVICGDRAYAVLGPPRHPSPIAWCCLLLLAVVGFLVEKLVKAAVASYGYSP
jgi:hypothetical protein